MHREDVVTIKPHPGQPALFRFWGRSKRTAPSPGKGRPPAHPLQPEAAELAGAG